MTRTTRTFRIPVQAAQTGVPAWFTAQTTSTWRAINTRLSDANPCPGGGCAYSGNSGHAAVCDAWCGAVASPTSLIIAAQGGHMDYAGNEVYVLNLTAESPAWVREVNPSTNVQQNVGYYADGKPTSRHGGADQCFIPAGITNGNRWFAPHGVAVYGGATPPTNKAASYVPGSGAYDPQNTFPDFPGDNGNSYEGCTAWDSGSNLVWVKEANDSVSGGVYSFNPATKAWSSRYGMWGLGSDQAMGVIDPVRRCFLFNGAAGLYAIDLASPASNPIAISASGSGPTTPASGLVYNPVSGVFFAWNGGATVYRLTPGANWRTNAWAWSTLTNAGGSATPTSANAWGTFGRFAYISALHAFVVVNRTSEQAYVYKLPAAT